MKKTLVLLMCCLAMAFASCHKDPQPTPENEPANKRFIGFYEGNIYLNGTANAPQLAQFNMPDGLPLDSMMFQLTANITAGENDETANVLFTIISEPENQSYETTGTVSGNTINFGDLTYHYVEGPSTFDVTLTLTGNLNGNALTLTGPATGTGKVNIEGFPVPLDITVEANVDGIIRK